MSCRTQKGFELIAYQKTRQLTREIFDITKKFPREVIYSRTDQIRRSSRSVGAQIAEGWAKRWYETSFVSKLVDADGEQMETQYWLEVAVDCNYLDRQLAGSLISRCEEVGRLLAGTIAKVDKFSNPKALQTHEKQAEYFADADTEH